MTQTKNTQDTLTRTEVVAFFKANPYTRDTAYGLAARLHRSPRGVKMACDLLVSLGILQTNYSTNNNIYRLKNKELIKQYSN